MKFGESLVTFATYICHTDRHFSKIVKFCSRLPNACKSIKNWKLKIFRQPILSSTHMEESKNIKNN